MAQTASKILKRSIIGALLATAAALLIFGPRPTGKQPDDPEAVVIQYWEKWTGAEASQMMDIVDEFNRTVGKEKKIFVAFLSQTQVDQKTLVATANGVPPDVAGIWDKQIPQFAAMNALEPLDDLAAPRGITAPYYKPAYWKGCTYAGRLYALVSTPAAMALHYNKRIFEEDAAKLRAAGLDPTRPPQTIHELDRYSEALDLRGPENRLLRAGHLPIEPGWYIDVTGLWFGAELYDERTRKLQLDSPANIAAYDWIRSYSTRLGVPTIRQFKGGFGNFDSPQNAFLAGKVAMEQQGPWMANYIEHQSPELNRWNVSPQEIAREKNFEKIKPGMTRAQVESLLGPATTDAATWLAGPHRLTLTFTPANTISSIDLSLRPAEDRRNLCVWAAAPFPSADPPLRPLVTYTQFDALVIPRGAKHPKEAFEFIAFVNRQDISEKLCSSHCKNSPLAKVSRAFIDNHPNPYIEVFEQLAASPNARGIPRVPTWPAVSAELGVASEQVYTLVKTPAEALNLAQRRKQEELDRFFQVQDERAAVGAGRR
jgi:ABC-type glycerol-3-phosphate transport system substrate-binding protein